jgi:hypothetical protein
MKMAPDEPGTTGSATREPHETYLADLASYVFGALGPDETDTVERHLSTCSICHQELPLLQAAVAGLGEVPPEAFIDGPPEDAELLVRRTMRRIQAERVQPTWTYRRTAAVAAVAAAVAITSGVLIGRGTAPRQLAEGPGGSAQPTSSASVVAGTRTIAMTDAVTGARLTGSVVPAKGWVRVSVTAAGIPEGQRCLLLVVPKQGAPVQAGSWLVSADGAQKGTSLQGTALVPIDQVAAIKVTNTVGHVFVTAPA